ncbi:MAG: polyprenol monophosphomannose synthase [Aggregatilineales bacterium]
MPKTVIVLPTYNEAENLPLMVEALFALELPDLHLLIVDDESPDGTGDLAETLALQHDGMMSVLHRKEKSGLGPAYIAGFKHALAMGADYVLQMDADFSHQPRYIPEMIALLEKGADMVLGSRFIRGGSVDESWGMYRKLLSWWANRIYVPTLLHIPIYDATGGYRLWRRETLIGIDLERIQSNGYVFQVEMAYVTVRLGFKVVETPIYFPDRKRGESKMDSKIALEAAKRVFEIRRRHHQLNPLMRRTEPYATESAGKKPLAESLHS